MISQFTWPNFRSGSDRDGVRVLIEEKGFAHDVKYGHTKIFIRSPNTLFKLEQVYCSFENYYNFSCFYFRKTFSNFFDLCACNKCY